MTNHGVWRHVACSKLHAEGLKSSLEGDPNLHEMLVIDCGEVASRMLVQALTTRANPAIGLRGG